MQKKDFLIVLLAASIAGALGYFGLTKLTGLTDTGYQVAFGTIFAMTVFSIATSFYLLTSLAGFKFATKRAYYIIVAGIIFYALAQLEQVGIILVFTFLPDIKISDFMANALFLVPYSASSIALYLGLKKLAGLLGINTWPIYLTLAVTTAIAFSSLLLPSPPTPDPSLGTTLKIIFIISTWCAALSGIAALVALRIRDNISSTYYQPMSWLATAAGMLSLASLQEVVIKDTNLINSIYVANSLDILPFLVAGLLFMKAGKAIKSATLIALPSNATYIDAVTYTAQLVSNPHEIDSSLDNLRQITAGLQPGAPLTPTDKNTIVQLYYTLENYLITKEPLRNLTREGLRSRLTAEFQQELATAQTRPAEPISSLQP